MISAAADLDKDLGGLITSIRDRGEFVGNELETFLIIPPQNSIKAKLLLLHQFSTKPATKQIAE